MWGTHPDQLYRAQSEAEGAAVNLHNIDDTGERPHQPEESESNAASTFAPTKPGALPSSEMSSADPAAVGTWGERDVGGPVDFRQAMNEFEDMRRTLSRISTSGASAKKTRSRGSIFRSKSLRRTQTSVRRASTGDADSEKDIEAEAAGDAAAQDGDFELGDFIRDGHFERRTGEGQSAKKVGVVFKNLTVKGVGAKATFVRTLPDAVLGTFGPDLYRLVCRFVPALNFQKQAPTRDLIHDFSGVIRNGEMMLVLGRPGAGCSTFLRTIANNRDSYAGVSGEVLYGGISAEEQAKRYRGEVIYNPEVDQHMPQLNVWQTLQFALLNKTRKNEHGEVPIVIKALLKMFGITHTKYTAVGNEYVPGVSGGERKRVSIAETLATKSTVVCWDNSTRGLDASTALDYANSLRIMTDISDRTSLVTLYQAGEGIYELMDKVLLIHEGRMIYQGPAKEAKRYFVDLGFHCPSRQTTADFLTSITDPLQQQFVQGREAQAPKTAQELEKVFTASPAYQKVLRDIEAYEQDLQRSDHADAREFKQSVEQSKSKTVRKQSSYTVSYVKQIVACTKREFWLILGDTTTLYTKFFIIVSNGLIVGSLFHGQASNTDGAFSRGGTLFFSILFLGWLQLSELMKAVSGRGVIARHKDYALYRPSAVTVARVITDIPVLFVQVVIFCIIMYFMTDLYVDVSKFWIYLLFVYTTTACITALYRMFGALSPTIDDAVRFSGIGLNLLIIYTGYVIPKPQLLTKYIWFGWIYYINPLSYAFEGVLTNEFTGRVMDCSPTSTVPQGPGYGDPAFQGCAVAGAQRGSLSITGQQYIGTAYQYTRSHLWRNWAVVLAFTILYIVVTVLAAELFSFVGAGGGALIFKKSKKAKEVIRERSTADEEKGGDAGDSSASSGIHEQIKGETMPAISKSESIFTWKDVDYSVPYQGGERQLLNKISGYAKPGLMTALMGASGAGKTTLLNTLAQRQKVGVVAGEMVLDGRPLGPEFQRGTGFCEQMDLHDGTQTIREALEFSAILRQERDVPRADKVKYVDDIIELLELGEMQDAIVASLGVEQRKRLTIGVELAAKPNLLLFLDEPTSGLDSQSAYSIIRFLKKLARAGQAIICTIHQPSSILIQQFDMILAINPGGHTFYFGPIGDAGSTVIKYFADRGVQCPPDKNVAEFILETAAKGGKRKDGKRLKWNEEWRNSEENKELIQEIERLKASRSKAPAPEVRSQHEFASPVWLQCTMLTKRVFIQHWRDPSYLYGKLFVSVIIGIFNGFTFYKLGNSILDMNNRMFSSFLIILIPPTIVNGVVPKFYQNRALWEMRELPSRIYGWIAFCTANVVAEIPSAIVGSLIYWLLWYWPTGLPRDSSTAGYTFLMTMLFFLFQASWGQWICAFAPSFTVISNVLPFFFVMFSLFNGVIRPYNQISVFWRYWMYYLNPSTYWIGGILSATLDGIPVQCQQQEAAHFNPPSGQTCGDYARAFLVSAPGYIMNPSATSNCGYCPYSVGNDYLLSLNVEAKDKWPYFGIFLGFVISNMALVYFFIWSVRIRGWTFGFGPLFGTLGKGVGVVKSLVVRKKGN
ncbi:MAG: hypothetical protein M1836_004665 [Candelina mexicana]|nr:MAG: hypothetical protein M1836_004665 [Candelina mexicana]